MVYRAGSTPEWLICALPANPAFGEPAARIRQLGSLTLWNGGRAA
jgi:hypothetical protein